MLGVQQSDLMIRELVKALDRVLVDRLEHPKPTVAPATNGGCDERLERVQTDASDGFGTATSKLPSKPARRATAPAPFGREGRSSNRALLEASGVARGRPASDMRTGSERSSRVSRRPLEDRDSRRGELESQRQSVEPAANLGDRLIQLR